MPIKHVDLKNKMIEELELIPDEKLSELYDFIHYFRLGLQSSESKVKTSEMMKFAGSWKDLPEETFEAFTKEIEQRRKQAFSRRRRE